MSAFLMACAKQMDTSFQKTREDPDVKLFQVLDETPALKSMFEGLDSRVFNQKLNDLLNANPDLSAQIYRKMANTFYGTNAVFPRTVRNLSDSFVSFHDVYTRDPNSLDSTLTVVDDVLSLDPEVMKEGVASILAALGHASNWHDLNDDGKVDPGELFYWVDKDGNGEWVDSDGNQQSDEMLPVKWDFFSPEQEFGDIGMDGIANLINNVDFVWHLYNNADDLSKPSIMVRKFLQTFVDKNEDIEERVQDLIDFIRDPDPAYAATPGDPDLPYHNIRDVETEVADWMVADPHKVLITEYLINDLYPMIKEPVLEDAVGEKNFIKRGRELLDEQARIFSTKKPSLTGTGDELLTQWFLGGLNNDYQFYKKLEVVPDYGVGDSRTGQIFDFSYSNDLLYWLKETVMPKYNASLDLTASDTDTNKIKKNWVQKILWTGSTYDGYGGSTSFPGLFYVDPAYKDSFSETHGYVTRMAKFNSADGNTKPFRKYTDELLNKTTAFKEVSLNYSGESMLEAIITNLQLHLLGEFYSTDKGKWALTPKDGVDYFGDSNRNIQSLLGNVVVSLRNAVYLNEDGVNPPGGTNPDKNLSMLAQLTFVTAAGYGLVDKTHAPGELSLENCLISMDSKLKGADTVTLPIDFKFIVSFTIDFQMKAFGNDTIDRKSIYESSWTPYATQRSMPSMELLQPGTFRHRWGSSNKGDWHGKFSASQGDIRGIAHLEGNEWKIITTNWTLTEVALACWEGYGPFTYKGKAPNGSKCKYRNSWYSDWYRMGTGTKKGPGCGTNAGVSESRYRVYEAIYRPAKGQIGFEASGSDADVPKYGYIRFNADNGSYADDASVKTYADSHADHKVTLDCATREEAIRKNFEWVLNKKKYMYLIPLHIKQEVLGNTIELWMYSSINANGILGVTKAKRWDNNSANNARWGKETGVNITSINPDGDKDDGNLDSLGCILDSTNTYRFRGVSFENKDYCIAMDFRYEIEGWLSWIISGVVNLTTSCWKALGDYPVLPPVVGKNFECFGQIAESKYSFADLSNLGDGAKTSSTYRPYVKFQKFYDTYFPGNSFSSLKDNELPPIPKVNGVTYPLTYNDDGSVKTWDATAYEGESKGKFEDLIAVLAVALGTIHEDGAVYKDAGGTQPLSGGDNLDDLYLSTGIGYYAPDGFRARFDDFILMMCTLNQEQVNSSYASNWRNVNYAYPGYNAASLMNILIDLTGQGNRAGVLPTVLQSRYANINDTTPIKESIEKMIRQTVRMYMNNFGLTQGYAGVHGSQGPADWQDLQSYYNLDGDGNKIVGSDGYYELNPALDWNIPINRLRYFLDDRSLDQLERTINFVKDLSKDARFVSFLKRSVPAVNNYLALKYIDQEVDAGNPKPDWATAQANAFQLDLTDADIDDLVEFVNDFDFQKLFTFIRENKLNDIERFYNFSLDDWNTDPAYLQDNFDDLNHKLIKYFSFNVKEGLIDGIYKIKKTAPQASLPTGFKPGEVIYGLGKYVKTDASDPYAFEDKGTYFKYIDIATWVNEQKVKDDSDATKYIEESFPGLNRFFSFREDPRWFDTSYDANCEAYTDNWYRGGYRGNKKYSCPNIYNGHKYDLRVDKIMTEYNKAITDFVAADFNYGASAGVEDVILGSTSYSVTYKRPVGFINTLFGYNGSSYQGIQIDNELKYIKDKGLDGVYKTEFDISDTIADALGFVSTDYVDVANKTVTARKLIEKADTYVKDNLFEYEYNDAGDKETYESIEAAGTHKHKLNNITWIIATLLNPDDQNYQTKRMFDAWVNFVETANIAPKKLNSVKEAVGNLLWDKEKPGYTYLFTNTLKNLPGLLEEFQRKPESTFGYEELLQLGMVAFAPDGIGTYLLDNMATDSRYDSWDLVEEFNYLLNQNIFLNYQDVDTFWWQSGNLLEDLAIILENRTSKGDYTPLDYYGAVRGLFQ